MGRPEHFKCKNCCYGEPWESGVVCERFPGIPYPRAIVCGEETGGTACYAASLYKDRDDGCGEFSAEWPEQDNYVRELIEAYRRAKELDPGIETYDEAKP